MSTAFLHKFAVTLLNSPFSNFVFQKIGLVSCQAGQYNHDWLRTGTKYSEAVLHPTVLLNMIQVDEATGEGISMRRCENTS